MIPEPNLPARPDEFVGRNGSIEAFRQVLAHGLLTGRTPSFAVFGDSAPIHRVSDWLYGKTFGHPYFMAFISRQLLTLAQGSLSDPELLWPVIFRRLEQEKFRSDLSNVTEREAQLLRDAAALQNDEIAPSDLSSPYDRNYLKRLTEKNLLLRVGRGRYKLYHRLFREFLRQIQ